MSENTQSNANGIEAPAADTGSATPAKRAPAKKAAAKKAPAKKATAKAVPAIETSSATTLVKEHPESEIAEASTEDISVTVLTLGTGEASVSLPVGATVSDLLSQRGLSLKEGDVFVASQAATADTVLEDGQTVTIATKIKGGL